jgi:dipeptide/tripeptide permease
VSGYLFQFFVLLLGAILCALWARRNRGRPARAKNGFNVVRWGLGLRLVSAAFLTAMLQQFALSAFTRAGPISWRGHEFSTETGDSNYINSY